jgi:hypothetical protein
MEAVEPETLALRINKFALLTLREYQANEGWSWRNWMLESHRYGAAHDPEIRAAVADGWAPLMTHGPVAWRRGGLPFPSGSELPIRRLTCRAAVCPMCAPGTSRP